MRLVLARWQIGRQDGLINKDRLLTEFVQMLEINSPARREGQMAELVAGKLREIGCEVRGDNAGELLGGQTGNIVATLPATARAGTKLLLCAHMDTVAPTEGIRVIQENGIIRQEGAAVLGADDKGGIAAILEGMRSVVESGEPHGQVQALILICEEVGLLGSKHLDMGMIDSELGYVFDSGQPVGHLVSSAPTHDSLVISFRGVAAHAGVCPEEGVSAIAAAASAISRMKLGRVDAETTANAGVISGGTARNVVPEMCEVRAEARSRDIGKLDRQVQEMKDACEQAAAEVGASVSVEVTREYRGYKHAEGAPLVQFALRAAASLGFRPDLLAHGGGSDCNILNENGLPTAVVGVGYEKIHTAEEYIEVENLVRSAELAAALVRASGQA